MAGILNTVYSLAVLAVALAGIVYVLGIGTTGGGSDEGEGGTSWWSWGILIVVAVFLIAQVGMLLMA
jgi:hypothetical protein